MTSPHFSASMAGALLRSRRGKNAAEEIEDVKAALVLARETIQDKIDALQEI